MTDQGTFKWHHQKKMAAVVAEIMRSFVLLHWGWWNCAFRLRMKTWRSFRGMLVIRFTMIDRLGPCLSMRIRWSIGGAAPFGSRQRDPASSELHTDLIQISHVIKKTNTRLNVSELHSRECSPCTVWNHSDEPPGAGPASDRPPICHLLYLISQHFLLCCPHSASCYISETGCVLVATTATSLTDFWHFRGACG